MPGSTTAPFSARFLQAYNQLPPAEGELPQRRAPLAMLHELHDLGLAHGALLRASRGPGDVKSDRRVLRTLQVLGAVSILNLPLCGALGTPAFCWLLPLVAVLFFKKMTYGGTVAVLMPTSAGRGGFWLLQFLADFIYTAGLLQGLLSLSPRRAR
jgi:hypothetical protein